MLLPCFEKQLTYLIKSITELANPKCFIFFTQNMFLAEFDCINDSLMTCIVQSNILDIRLMKQYAFV